MWLNKTI